METNDGYDLSPSYPLHFSRAHERYSKAGAMCGPARSRLTQPKSHTRLTAAWITLHRVLLYDGTALLRLHRGTSTPPLPSLFMIVYDVLFFGVWGSLHMIPDF